MGNLPPAAPSSSVNQTGRDCSLEQYGSNDYCLTEAEYIADILYEMRLTPFKIGLLCLYAIVFAIGLLGNLLVIIAILRTPQMRTATNLFLLNLALADFFVIMFCLVPTVVEDFLETWVFGSAACRVLKYLQPVSVTVSVLTLTFNSVERLLAICFPLNFKATKRRICSLIMLIWTVALVSNLHYPFKMEIEPFAALPKDQILLTQCRSTWGPTHYFINASAKQQPPTLIISAAIDPDTVTKIVDSLLFFVLPLIWMLIAYTMICRRLWYSTVPGQTAGSNGQRSSANRTGDATLKQRRRTALMLIAIVLIFFLCYLPVHILRAAHSHISREDLFENKQTTKKIVQSIVLFSHWICYFNSAINPIVYTFMSSRFRSEFLKIFSCCRRWQNGEAATNSHAGPQRTNQQCLQRQGRTKAGVPGLQMRELNHSAAPTAAAAAETRRLLSERNRRNHLEEVSIVHDANESDDLQHMAA